MVGYACARLLEIAAPGLPRTAIVALDVVSAMGFALAHGGRRYGARGIAVFTLICLAVGNVVENVGVATGFPFGRYYFVELMGPKLLNVPVLLGLAYIGMAYVSWHVAEAITGPGWRTAKEMRWLALPALAALVMTAWDVAQDPVWSTVLKGWVWRDGGAWFGVPLSNYLGWLGTVFTIFTLWGIYLRRQPRDERQQANAGAAVVFYSLCAAGNVAQLWSARQGGVTCDPTGKVWSVDGILAASAVVSLVVMGGFARLAWRKIHWPAKGQINEPAALSRG